MPRLSDPIRERPDGRRALLVYLDPNLVEELEKAALDETAMSMKLSKKAAQGWANRSVGEREK